MQTDRSTQRRRRQLPDRASFLLVASIIVGFLAASAAPTPLYSTYAQRWHFSPITTTVVFGSYALAVLVALLVLGRLSDHIGRRPVLLAAFVVQIAAMALFEFADGVPELLLARVVQGLATGAAAGAIGAALVDFDTDRGPLANALAAPIGTGSGAIGAGLVVQFLPAPTHLVYAVLAAVFVLQTVGVAFMRETAARVPGAIASLRPEFTLPPRARRAMIVATPALIAAWALPSFYASLGPDLVATLAGSDSLLLAGTPLFLLALGAVVVILALRHADAERVMLVGALGMVVGVAGTLVAVAAGNVVALLLATLVAGGGFGGGFQGAIRTVVPLAGQHERAGLLSLLYLVSYLALGVPAMAGGLLAVHNGDVTSTAIEYGIGVMLLAGLAAAGLARSRRPRGRDAEAESDDGAREQAVLTSR